MMALQKTDFDGSLRNKLRALLDIDGNFLFGGKTSLPIAQIQKRFSAAAKLSGVKKIRLHDLRHSHATILINSGVNIVAVSKHLGHSKIDITLNTYLHLLEKTDAEMLKIIKKLTKRVPQIKKSP